jgi:hypothetical protein
MPVWRCLLARTSRGIACYDRISWKSLVAHQSEPHGSTPTQHGVPLFDRNVGDAELADGPRIGHEMSARLQRREGGDAACERERQQ